MCEAVHVDSPPTRPKETCPQRLFAVLAVDLRRPGSLASWVFHSTAASWLFDSAHVCDEYVRCSRWFPTVRCMSPRRDVEWKRGWASQGSYFSVLPRHVGTHRQRPVLHVGEHVAGLRSVGSAHWSANSVNKGMMHARRRLEGAEAHTLRLTRNSDATRTCSFAFHASSTSTFSSASFDFTQL